MRIAHFQEYLFCAARAELFAESETCRSKFIWVTLIIDVSHNLLHNIFSLQ